MRLYQNARRYFNSLQSECFSICYHSDINMVVSAPTGSGKTVLFELCILRLLSRFVTEDMRFLPPKGTLKTVSSSFSSTDSTLWKWLIFLASSSQANSASHDASIFFILTKLCGLQFLFLMFGNSS